MALIKNLMSSAKTFTYYLLQKVFSRRNIAFSKYGRLSYSQEGEDLLLDRALVGIEYGFYVDIGAHHPTRYSNTYYFYKKGWRGLNIDATPGSMKLFKKNRSEDINLEIPISDTIEDLTFHIYHESALNTFDPSLAKDLKEKGEFELKETIQIKTKPLEAVFDSFLPANKKIDFMTIDVEGYDLKVLKSNNWQKYRPTFLLIEILDFSWQSIMSHPTCMFIQNQGYTILAKTINTVLYKEN